MFDLCKILDAAQTSLNRLVPYRQQAATLTPSRQFVGWGASGSRNVCSTDGCPGGDACPAEHREHNFDELRQSLQARGCSGDSLDKIVSVARRQPVRTAAGCSGGSCGR